MSAFLEQSFIQPEFESRTYDFEGQLALDEDLYGPKVRVAGAEEISTSLTELVKLLKKQKPTPAEVAVVKEELKELQFPTDWKQVTRSQYIDGKSFGLDEVPMTALVFSRAIELGRDLQAPIKNGDTFISLSSALSTARGGRRNRFLHLEQLEVVELVDE